MLKFFTSNQLLFLKLTPTTDNNEFYFLVQLKTVVCFLNNKR